MTPDDPQDERPTRARSSSSRARSFTVARPRLGYPALLFTELDTDDAFQKLLDDKTFLHTAKPAGQTIKEYREVSYFDPDVDTHAGGRRRQDASARQPGVGLRSASPIIRLYSTLRTFDADLETPFNLQLEYRNANVIDFGNEIDLGDLQLSQGRHRRRRHHRSAKVARHPDHDLSRVLGQARKPGTSGSPRRGSMRTLYRVGEPFEFFVREDTEDESDFFKPGLESHQLQGLYLQPDPPQVNNPLTIVASIVAGSELPQSTLMERIAVAAARRPQGPDAHRQAGRAHPVRVQQPDPAHAGARQFVAHVRDAGRAPRPLAVRAVVRGAARLDVGRPGRPGYRGSPRPAVHRRSGDRRRRGGGLRAVAEDGEPGGHDRSRPELHARWSSSTRSNRRRTSRSAATAAQPVPEHDRRRRTR